MTFHRGILIILAWIGMAVKGFPQANSYAFSRLNINNGLSNNQVNCFYKDKQGFLWTGTRAGLNRYDGYGFKVFYHDLKDTGSLSDDYIVRILEGPDNKMWIETRSGFNIFDPLSEKISRNAQEVLKAIGIRSNAITDIRKDQKGNFWFLDDRQTLYIYNIATQKSSVVFKNHFQQNQIAAFGFNKKGTCIIIHANGLMTILDPETGKVAGSNKTLATIFGSSALSYSIFIDSEDELWIYTTSGNPLGLLRLNLISGNSILYEKDKGDIRLNTNLVVGVQEDNQGKIWICTDHGGINVYDKEKNTIQYLLHNDDDRKSLSQNSITASYKDNEGIIWLGTYRQGISYYHENIIKFPVYRKLSSDPNSLPFNDVNSFAEDAKGNLWIGTNGDGLIYFDRAANRFTQYKHQPGNSNSISNNVIVSLLIDHESKLWIGSYFGGLDCYANGKFTNYKNNPADPNSISDDRVWEIYEDTRKNLWIGTLNGGLNRFDRDKNIFYHMRAGQQNSISSNYIDAITEDSNGRLWVGTSNGVNVIDDKNNVVIYSSSNKPKSGLSNDNIICFFRDSRDLMWVGTRDGLNVFDPKKKGFRSFRIGDGLPGNSILNILEDEQHRLWISTSNGIGCLTINVAKDEIKLRSVNYGELEGLQGTEFNENAALKTSKGEIIFGGPTGFNIFQPSAIRSELVYSPVMFTDLQLFNKSVAVGEKINGREILSQSVSETKKIILRHNENNLTIEFAALNFFNPEKIRYAYRMDGLNENWIYTNGNMRKAIYTNLDPGNYVFRIKASGEDGSWDGSETTLAIKIHPPFWGTPLAYILYVVVVVMALWLARRILLERARMRFEVEQQRKEAERVQQLDALKTKFFTNVSHEFRTPLSLILSPLEKIVKKTDEGDQKKQLQLVQRNAKRLLNLVNQLLDFRKMEVQELKLNTAEGDIAKFIKDISCSFTDIAEKKLIQFSYTTSVEKLYTIFDHDKLERILFNLLSNAFKFTSENGMVSVELLATKSNVETLLEIKVRDTGIGIPADKQEKIFERFFQHDIPGTMINQGSGIGLAITKEFVNLHNGTISVESTEYNGSCFTVLLPVKEIEMAVVELEEAENMQATVSILGTETDEPIAEPEDRLTTPGKKKHTVLLVEDNEDFLFYLKDNLREFYNIAEAVNGKEGWQKTLAVHPDIVVSDISMPLMDGIELCKKIKQDQRTKLIPVVLLTALIGEEQQLRSLETGAADYMTKPFNFEILLSRVKNLLSQQESLRQTFTKQVEVKTTEIKVDSPDEKFVQDALIAIEKNISNADFSVEELSRNLYMSRVTVYKRLFALTKKTPTELIRSVRLQRAAQLLEKSQMTVTEVAYETGFNTPRYFSQYFKEQYGVLPSAYQAVAKANAANQQEKKDR